MDDFEEATRRISRALAFAAATAPDKNYQEFALALEEFKKSVAAGRTILQAARETKTLEA